MVLYVNSFSSHAVSVELANILLQMWALFTKALARGTSTTQVSIINTSANFMITAILGFVIFTESLPPLWWVGAALLVAGNVIIGRREEKDPAEAHAETHGVGENDESAFGEEGEGLLGDSVELVDESEVAVLKKTPEEEDDILDLGIPIDTVMR
jgi:multidrug transporter EmrE-like cation transporter